MHSQIIRLKTKNDEQQEEYLNKFELLQEDLMEEKKKANYVNRAHTAPNENSSDYVDPEDCLKRLLQRIILVKMSKIRVAKIIIVFSQRTTKRKLKS